MEVATTPVNLGKAQLLIINNGPDVLSVGEFGQDEDDWFPLESGSAVTVKAFNNGIGVVSAGVSDVGVLVGGTGIFPPGVDAPDLSGYQPLDSDLTAIAALTTTSTGRSLLAAADAAAIRAIDLSAPATPAVGTSLGTTGTINLDMAALDGTYQSMGALTGAITFTSSNRAAGRTVTIKIINGSTLRAFTFPAWIFVGAAAPASIAASKTGILTVTFFDTTDAAAVAAYSVQP